jgi:hypothetical protein
VGPPLSKVPSPGKYLPEFSEAWKKAAQVFQGLEKAAGKLSKAWKNTVPAFPTLGKLPPPQIINRKS